MDTITTALHHMGLSSKEADIYLALLKLGDASAYRIAQIAQVKKPTTYVILEDLIHKGLAYKTPHGKVQLYGAHSPEQYFHKKQKEILSAQRALPEIMSLMNVPQKVRTLYFDGAEGIRQALMYHMDDYFGEEIVGFYAAAKNIDDHVTTIAWEWAEEMKKRNITVRGIAPDHPSLASYRNADATYGRIYKSIPYSKYSSESSMDVLGNFVRIIDLTKDFPQAVIIENERVAKMVRQIFEMMWKKTT